MLLQQLVSSRDCNRRMKVQIHDYGMEAYELTLTAVGFGSSRRWSCSLRDCCWCCCCLTDLTELPSVRTGARQAERSAYGPAIITMIMIKTRKQIQYPAFDQQALEARVGRDKWSLMTSDASVAIVRVFADNISSRSRIEVFIHNMYLELSGRQTQQAQGRQTMTRHI